MHPLDIALAAIGGTVLVVGLFSKRLKRTILQEPLIGTLIGLAIGPYGLDWLKVREWAQAPVLEDVARVTLALGLSATAQRISAGSLRRFRRPATLLLTAAMLGMWGVVWAAAALTLSVPLWTAAAIGAALAPTDPVVASAIVTGEFAEKHLPTRIRSTLSMESGANDGVAYIFALLPIFMLESVGGIGTHPGIEVWKEWLIDAVGRGAVLGIGLGGLIGWLAATALTWSERRHLIGGFSVTVFIVALPLFTLGVARVAHSDGLLAVPIAGLVFHLMSRTERQQRTEHTQEAMAKLFALPMFVLFGAVLPIGAWLQMGTGLIGFLAAVILLRRILVVALLYPFLRPVLKARDTAYVAWFGPVGVAAIYYANFDVRQVGVSAVWNIVSAAVFASLVIHGGTAAPLTRVYAKRAQAERRRTRQRTRIGIGPDRPR